jgi:hypothetical protein
MLKNYINLKFKLLTKISRYNNLYGLNLGKDEAEDE